MAECLAVYHNYTVMAIGDPSYVSMYKGNKSKQTGFPKSWFSCSTTVNVSSYNQSIFFAASKSR